MLGLLNIRSIYNKTTSLTAFIKEHDISVMCIVESWLHDSIRNSELFLNGFRLHRLDRVGKGGGGIVILIANNYCSSIGNS